MAHAPTKPPPAPSTQAVVSPELVEQPPIILRLPPQWALTDECVILLGESNESLGFERTREGALKISFPSGIEASGHEFELDGELLIWWRTHRRGLARGATAGHSLPDGSLLVPDASWTSDERLEGLDLQPSKPIPAAPDFVVEVRSRSQSLEEQQDKMQQWMANGVRLGWLLDPIDGQAWIYRAGQEEPQTLERPATLSGEDVAEGLTMDLSWLWAPQNS